MRILILSEYTLVSELNGIWNALGAAGDELVATTNGDPEQTSLFRFNRKPDFIISYGYRHILKGKILEEYKDRLINIHLSYLPYNRGASPNLWAHYDDTPSGVSIHRIDAEIDTGLVVARRFLTFYQKHTLESSYEILQEAAGKLFFDMWPRIREGGKILVSGPDTIGSYHTKAQSEELLKRLPLGYRTKIREVAELGRMDREIARKPFT